MEEWVGGLALPVDKTFFLNKAVVISEVYYGCRNKQIGQWGSIEDPETDPSYMEMLYDKNGFRGHWVKYRLLNKWC